MSQNPNNISTIDKWYGKIRSHGSFMYELYIHYNSRHIYRYTDKKRKAIKAAKKYVNLGIIPRIRKFKIRHLNPDLSYTKFKVCDNIYKLLPKIIVVPSFNNENSICILDAKSNFIREIDSETINNQL